ncbi:mucin-4 [Rhineura floridana]|uniref:mucin-4 n=1 Tax=Rhineura floridana TaxID=261503 RepID=UPI002AC807B8|nr:mucin-4 [Rhineura floridana]
MTTTERALLSTEEIQATEPFMSGPLGTEGTLGESPGSVRAANSSGLVEKETLNSEPVSTTAGNSNSSTDGPKEVETRLPEGNAEEATEAHIKVFLAKANSSSSSLEKGTTGTTAEVSEETATPANFLSKGGETTELPAEVSEETTFILLSKGTASTFSDEQPEATELLTDMYSSVTDPSLPSATRGEERLASPLEEDANNSVSSETVFSPPTAEGRMPLDVATGGTNVDSELNPTLASWEEVPDAVPEPDEDAPRLSPEAVAPSSSPADPSSDSEELPTEETRATPADGSSPPFPAEEDAGTSSSELPPSNVLPPSDGTAESPESGEPAAASSQPSPDGEAPPGVESAPAEGRGDTDSSASTGVPGSDAEATAIPSSTGPEVSPESTAEVPAGELEDLVGEGGTSNPSPGDESTGSPSGFASPSDTPSGPSDLGSDSTAVSPIGLSTAPGSSSQLPEDGEAQAASATKSEAEEGSGSPNSNEETPFASSSPEQELPPSGTEMPDGENVAAGLDSGTASPLNPGVETDSSELADKEQPTISTKSESSSEMTTINSAGAAEKVPGALPDSKMSPPPPLLEDETAARAQGASGEMPSPTSLSAAPSQRQEEESSPSQAPGNAASSPEESEAPTGKDVASGSATNEVAAQTSSEGQSEMDFLPASVELGPPYEVQLPVGRPDILDNEESSGQPPAEDAVASVPYSPSGGESAFPSSSPDETLSGVFVSESDTTEAPSNRSPGSPESSQPPPDSGMEAGSDASIEPEELEHSAAANGEEASSALSTTQPESAPADTEAIEEGNDSGGLGNGAALPSREEPAGATSKTAADEGSIADSSSAQDEISAAENSPTSSAEITDAESEGFTPLPVDVRMPTKPQGPSEKLSSSASFDGTPSGPFGLESEGGEASVSEASENLGSSPQDTEVAESNSDGVGSIRLVATEVAETSSSEGQAGTELPPSDTEMGPTERAGLPVGPPGASANGEIPTQPPVENRETLVANTASGEESSSSLASLGEESPPSVVSGPSGAQPSGSSSPPGSDQSSPAPALRPGSAASEEAQEFEDTSRVSGKETDLAPSDTERVESSGSVMAGSEESQLSPNGAATTDEEAAQSEGSSTVNGKEAYLAPSATESQVVSSSTEGAETAGSADSEGLHLSPDGAVAAGSIASEEEPEGISEGSGEESSLAPSATESQSASASTEGVEMAISGPAASVGSQPSPDGAAIAGPGASEGVEQSESSPAVSEQETPSGSSATDSPPTSADDEVSGGLGKGRPFLSTEGVETASSESTASEGPQPLPDGAATGGSNEKEPSLVPSAAESESASPSTKGVETSSLGSAGNAGSQPPLDGAATAEDVASQDGAESAMSEKKSSSAPLPTESQFSATSASKEISGGLGDGESSLPNEGMENPNLEPASTTGSQPSPDGEAEAGALASEDREESEMSEKKSSLAPWSTESQSPGASVSDELSGGLSDGESFLPNEGMETPTMGSASNAGSQPSLDGATSAGAVASEDGTESAMSEKKSSLAPLPTEPQFSATSASKEISGGLGNGEPSIPSEGMETPSLESASNTGSQPSPDGEAEAGALASEDREESEMSGEKSSLAPLSTGSESSGTSASKEATGGLSDGEFSLPTEGVETAHLGSAATKGSTFSTEQGLSPENVAEQLEEKSGSIIGGESFPQPSSVAMIHKASEGTWPSGSASPDGSLATEAGPNQVPGITDPSQPSSGSKDVGDNVASPENTGSTENSVSGQPVPSNSNALGGSHSSSPLAKAGAEMLRGGLESGPEPLGSIRASLQPFIAGGTKAAIDQKSGKESSSVFLPPSDTLPSGASNSGAGGTRNGDSPSQKVASIGKETGRMDPFPFGSESQAAGPSPIGLPSSSGEAAEEKRKGSSTAVSEGRGDADGSVSTANKELFAASAAGETRPSLSGTQLSPANTLGQLPAGEPGPEVKAETSPQPSKVEVTGSAAEHTLSGKPPIPVSTSSSSSSSSGSKATKSGSSGTSSLSPSSAERSKLAAGVSPEASGNSKASLPGKSDVRLAVSGATKSSQTSGKTSEKKPDSSSQDSKGGKTATANENSAKSGSVLAAPVPVSPVVSLFPYGANANDKEYVERKVDFNSPLFKPEIGIPLGKSLRDSLYFTDNGQIIFPASDKDISCYPNPPPEGFNGREKVPMIAVFWANADFSRGGGTIFYQEYVTQNTAKHPFVKDVEAKIHQDVESSFSAIWTLKITWLKAQSYPAQRRNSRTNTYQAILTTDGYRTYTLFLYQDGGMEWDYRKLTATNVLIGWTSGDGYFKNDDLMTKTPAEKYRPDQIEGYNTDVRGLWIYKLDRRVRVNYRLRCLDWVSHEGQPSAWNKDLPPCPCSLQQGLSDDRYTRSRKGLLDSRLTLLYSSSPNKYGAGVRCLYNKDNQLVEGHQEKVWKGSRKSSPNSDEELKVYGWCCNQAGNPKLCDKYSQKRPKIGCDGYRLSIRATSSKKKRNSESEEERD